MKAKLGILIGILGIVGGLYIGGWLMFVQPIVDVARAFDAGALTGVIIVTTILKCIFASAVGGVIAWVGLAIGGLLNS